MNKKSLAFNLFFRLSFANDGCLIPIACLRFNLFHIQVYYFMPSSRVLVCTPSNSAADLICIRLHNSGFLHAASLARVNASCRQNEVFNIVFRLMCLTISDLDFYLFLFSPLLPVVYPRSAESVLQGRRGHSSSCFPQDCGQHLLQCWHVP